MTSRKNSQKSSCPKLIRPYNKLRFFPDYFQTYGLGFFEYFQLSEDIGAEPLPILNCGLVCQYQNDPDQQVSLSKLDSYIQDALDLIA